MTLTTSWLDDIQLHRVTGYRPSPRPDARVLVWESTGLEPCLACGQDTTRRETSRTWPFEPTTIALCADCAEPQQ
jgi:hypothetical protein